MEEYGVCLHTEFEVCRQCGALSLCEHDTPPPSPGPADVGRTNEDDTADMVTSRSHEASEEIFNTYSHLTPLSNTQLLLQYGFLEEGNGADRVTFSKKEVESILGCRIEGEVEDGALFLDSEGEASPSLRHALSISMDEGNGDSRLYQLCDARLRTFHAKGDVEILTTAIDSVPSCRPRTGLAYRYLMGEALLLRACMERTRH